MGIWSQILSGVYYFFEYTIAAYVFLVLIINALLAYFGINALVRYQELLRSHSLKNILERDLYLPITIIVPAYNEELSIVESVGSFLSLHYPRFQVVVVSDGSTDNTIPLLIEAYDLYESSHVYEARIETQPVTRIFKSDRHPNLMVVEKENGGKGDAQNVGLNVAQYPIVAAVDADSLLDVEALLRASLLFSYDDRVVGVGASVRALNGATIENGTITHLALPDGWIERMQILEYSRAFFIGRTGWNAINALMIISGAFGLFKREMMLEVGGWSHATITEDIELVIRIHKYMIDHQREYRIEFIPEPLCWTEVPTDMGSLRRQRNRWHRGLWETLWMYRGMLFNRKYGLVGMLAFPYYWFVSGLSPFVELFGYIFVALAWVFGWLNPVTATLFIILSLSYGVLFSQVAIGIEALLVQRYTSLRDRALLVVLSLLEFFGYRQILLWERFKAMFEIQRKRGQWGKINRTGIS